MQVTRKINSILEEGNILILRELDTTNESTQQQGGKLKQMQQKAKLIKLAIPLNLSGYSVVTSVSINGDASTKAVTVKDDDNSMVEITEPITGELATTINFVVQPKFNVIGTGVAIPVPIAIIDASLKKASELDNKLLVFDYFSSSVVLIGYRIISYTLSIDSNSQLGYFSVTLKKSKNEGLANNKLKNYLTGVDKQEAIGFVTKND